MNDTAGNAQMPAMPVAVRSVAEVATPHASRYLQEFCRHFADRRPVSFDEHHGHVALTIGEYELEAGNGELRLMLAAPGGAEMAQLMGVAQRHLVRVALREELAIHWRVA